MPVGCTIFTRSTPVLIFAGKDYKPDEWAECYGSDCEYKKYVHIFCALSRAKHELLFA